MKRNLRAAAVMALVLTFPISAAVRKAVHAGQQHTITATIEAIDSVNRVLTLKGPEGHEVEVEVSEAIKRFPEIKVGDHLTITYSESIVLSVVKAEAAAHLASSVETGIAPVSGKKPAGVMARRIHATVEVLSIDPKTPSVTVRSAEGHTLEFHIADVKNLEGVKPGDKIAITYTEAVAMAVTTPKS